MILTDGGITLRPFTFEDASAHLAGEDENLIKWLSGGKSTLEGIQNWIKKNEQYWQDNGPIFNFAILNKEKKLVGMIEANTDFKNLEGVEEGDANISYGLYPFARGKGYVTRAIALIENFLKNKGIKRGIIRIDPENINSLNVAKRCGFAEYPAITTTNGERLVILIKDLH